MTLVVGVLHPLVPALVAKLKAEGHSVRLFQSKHEAKCVKAGEFGADEVVTAEYDDDDFKKALSGVEFVISSATAVPYMFTPNRPGWLGLTGDHNVDDVDLEGHEELLEAIQEHGGIKHVVYISDLFSGPMVGNWVLRKRYDVEAMIAESGVPFTIVRIGDLMEVDVVPMVAQAAKSGTITIVGDSEKRRSFLAAEDGAEFVVKALTWPLASGQTLSVAGPDDLSWDEIVDEIGQALGRPVTPSYKSSVPLMIRRFLVALTGVKLLGRPRLRFDLVDSFIYTAQNSRDLNMQACANLMQIPMTPLRYWLQESKVRMAA